MYDVPGLPRPRTRMSMTRNDRHVDVTDRATCHVLSRDGLVTR